MNDARNGADDARPAAAHDRWPRRRRVAGLGFVVLLSFLAGMTDAIGFLRAGDFLSFMSGNTTRLAIALAQGRSDAMLRLGGILLTFVAGNALGVVVMRAGGGRHGLLLGAVTAIMGLSALLVPPLSNAAAYLPLVLAMGMLNAAVDRVGGQPLGLTYVTGALSRLGKGLGRVLCGERDAGFLVQAVPWLGMIAGGLAGASLSALAEPVALWTACAFGLALTIVSAAVPRTWLGEASGLR